AGQCFGCNASRRVCWRACWRYRRKKIWQANDDRVDCAGVFERSGKRIGSGRRAAVSDQEGRDQASGTWITTSPEDTFELGAKIGRSLLGGELFLLNGPLGAGKTLFAKGIATGLGIDPDEVSSPSFTLVNRYQGRLKLY